MKQKIELILAEIERQMSCLYGKTTDFCNGEKSVLTELRSFIKSLPEEPKFNVGDMVVSTRNPSLTYKILQVGLPNELGKLDYEVEIYTDGKAGMKVGDRFIEHNIHLISCDKMDEWGKLIPEESVSKELEEAAKDYATKQYEMDSEWGVPDGCRSCYTPLMAAFKAGAMWQRNHVWHKTSERPDQSKDLCAIYSNGKFDFFEHIEGKSYNSYWTAVNQARADIGVMLDKWAYLDDLLPKSE